jgi:hypothetical protein
MTRCASDGSIELEMNPVQEFSDPRDRQELAGRVCKRALDGRLLS